MGKKYYFLSSSWKLQNLPPRLAPSMAQQGLLGGKVERCGQENPGAQSGQGWEENLSGNMRTQQETMQCPQPTTPPKVLRSYQCPCHTQPCADWAFLSFLTSAYDSGSEWSVPSFLLSPMSNTPASAEPTVSPATSPHLCHCPPSPMGWPPPRQCPQCDKLHIPRPTQPLPLPLHPLPLAFPQHSSQVGLLSIPRCAKFIPPWASALGSPPSGWLSSLGSVQPERSPPQELSLTSWDEVSAHLPQRILSIFHPGLCSSLCKQYKSDLLANSPARI